MLIKKYAFTRRFLILMLILVVYYLKFLVINYFLTLAVLWSRDLKYISIQHKHSWSQAYWAKTFFSYYLAWKNIILLTKYKTSLLIIYIIYIIIL